jgi:hypothetical protein
MPDNVNITVNETIENVVVNPSITTEVIDVNITGTTETINIDVTPNLTTVNINSISGSPVTKTSDLINDGEDGVNPFITLQDIPAVTGFVPYTGATQDVNLGEFGIQLGNLEFDTTPTNIPTGVGSLVWNDTAGTLDLKLKGNAVTLQIGQETVARVLNKTATNITLLEANYQIVRVTGAQGQRPKVDLALANNDLNSTTTLGLVTETILNNQEGFITTSGQVQQINTTGSLQGETWADGDVLYLSGTIAGQATNIKPAAPIHTVIIGFVEYAHITQGKIFVKVDNGYELEELHNVSAVAPNNNEVLTYDTPTLLWKPKTIASALGYTPFQLPSLTAGSVLFSNGTTIAQKNSNFFWDNTNNRLGIGTTTPNADLTITKSSTGTVQAYIKNSSNGTVADSRIIVANDTSIEGGIFLGSSTRTLDANTVLIYANQTLRFMTNNTASTGGTSPIIFQAGGASTTQEAMRVTGAKTVLIGTTVDQGGKLQIKAPGALSTDVALRVRNSADTGDLMTVAGSGNVNFNSSSSLSNIAFFSNGENRIRFYSTGQTVDNLQIYTNGGAYGSSYGEIGYLFKNTSTQMASINFDTRTSVAPFRFFVNPTGASSIDAMDIFRSGSVGIGTSNTEITSAILNVTSTTKGFLPPRMTSTQKNAIVTPASGLVVYDTTLGKLCVRGAAAWETITSI